MATSHVGARFSSYFHILFTSRTLQNSKVEESPWEKEKQTPRRKKGYHSVKKRKHSFVKVTGTSGAPRLRPDIDQRSRRQTKICHT